jgi:hypothetical protein
MTKKKTGPKSKRPDNVTPEEWKKQKDAARSAAYRARKKAAAAGSTTKKAPTKKAPAKKEEKGAILEFRPTFPGGVKMEAMSAAKLDNLLANFKALGEDDQLVKVDVLNPEAKRPLLLMTAIDLENEPPEIKKHILGLYNYARGTWKKEEEKKGTHPKEITTRIKGYRLLWEFFERGKYGLGAPPKAKEKKPPQAPPAKAPEPEEPKDARTFEISGDVELTPKEKPTDDRRAEALALISRAVALLQGET